MPRCHQGTARRSGSASRGIAGRRAGFGVVNLPDAPFVAAAREGRVEEHAQDSGGAVEGVSRAPSARTFRSLCSRDSRALVSSPMAAARMPGTLFAAIAMPIPLPQTSTPRANRPSLTPRATAVAKSG